MQGLLKTLGRSYSARCVEGAGYRRRFGSMALGGLVSASLLFISGAMFGAMTTIDVCPLVAKSTLVSQMEISKTISVVLALPSSDPAGLKAFVDHVSTPGDPLFRQFITPQEFANRFGGSASDYQFLEDWAVSNDLTISQESVGRTTLTLRGSVAVMNRLFKTQVNNYIASDGVTFYSAGIAPTVPAEIGSKVVAVIGLTSGRPNAALAKVGKTLGEHPAPNSALKPAGRTEALGTGPGGTYAPQDLQTAYSIPTWGSLVKGQTLAIFEQGYYDTADVSYYETYFKTGSAVKQVPISVNKSPVVIEPPIELEACLDVDMIIAMNPKVAKVLVYVDDYQWDPFDVAITDAFARIADDAQASVVSASYGEDEGFFIADGTEVALDTALQQCAAQGITVLASSGDNGAFGNGYHFPYNVSNPATDPYITGVGGTSLLTTTGEQYELEQCWNEFPYYGATGGGISTYWSQPAYQNIPYTGYTAGNGGSTTMRNVPDVAAEAAVTTGVAVYVGSQGGWLQVGGTSVASPLWAGYLSNINAALHWTGLGNLGFFNPILYSVGTTQFATPSDYMYDILNGDNGYVPFGGPGYYNGFGYSNTTGNGSIWGSGFGLQLLLSGKQAGTAPGPIVAGLKSPATSTSATIKWTTSSNAVGYAIGLYHAGSLFNIVQGFVERPPKTSLTFTNLIPSTTYNVFIWGFNASGGSVNPAQVSFSTLQ
jgi:subtilase family serine protease